MGMKLGVILIKEDDIVLCNIFWAQFRTGKRIFYNHNLFGISFSRGAGFTISGETYNYGIKSAAHCYVFLSLPLILSLFVFGAFWWLFPLRFGSISWVMRTSLNVLLQMALLNEILDFLLQVVEILRMVTLHFMILEPFAGIMPHGVRLGGWQRQDVNSEQDFTPYLFATSLECKVLSGSPTIFEYIHLKFARSHSYEVQ